MSVNRINFSVPHKRFPARLIACGALLSLASALTILPAARAATPDVKSGDYLVDSAHSQVIFHVTHFGFTTFSGIFPNAHGKLHIDVSNPKKSSLSITLPVADVETANPVLNKELKGAEWFNTAAHPDAKFVSQHVTLLGADHVEVAGLLTLNGVTKPLTLDAKFIGSGINPMNHKYTVGFSAMGHIQRSAYGVKTYVPHVADDVTLHIAGAFEKID